MFVSKPKSAMKKEEVLDDVRIMLTIVSCFLFQLEAKANLPSGWAAAFLS